MFLTNSFPLYACHETGILRLAVSVGALFCPGFFLRNTHASCQAAKVRDILYLRLFDIYGILWHTARPSGASHIHDTIRSTSFHLLLFGINVHYTLFYILRSWHIRLCMCHDFVGHTAGGASMVFDQLSTWRHGRPLLCVCGYGSYIETSSSRVRPLSSRMHGTLCRVDGQSRHLVG